MRAEHVVLDGKVVRIGETFVQGITLRYPGDMAGPAKQIIQCRCVASPK